MSGEDEKGASVPDALRVKAETLDALAWLLGVEFPDEFDIELSFKESGGGGRSVRLMRRGDVTIRQWAGVIREGKITDNSQPA